MELKRRRVTFPAPGHDRSRDKGKLIFDDRGVGKVKRRLSLDGIRAEEKCGTGCKCRCFAGGDVSVRFLLLLFLLYIRWRCRRYVVVIFALVSSYER